MLVARATVVLLLGLLGGAGCTPDCDRVGEHAGTAIPGFDANDTKERCRVMEWPASARKCVVNATDREAVDSCMAPLQTKAEAWRVFCEAPTDSGAKELDGGRERTSAIARWVSHRLVHPEVIRAIASISAAKDEEAKKAAARAAMESAGMESCEALNGLVRK
jgi:hypothetical protein